MKKRPPFLHRIAAVLNLRLRARKTRMDQITDTEGNNKSRVYCRNLKCRAKLKIPIGNPREAFCTRSCWQQFHRHRCLVCERPMSRNAEHQKVCHRAECKTAWRLKT